MPLPQLRWLKTWQQSPLAPSHWEIESSYLLLDCGLVSAPLPGNTVRWKCHCMASQTGSQKAVGLPLLSASFSGHGSLGPWVAVKDALLPGGCHAGQTEMPEGPRYLAPTVKVFPVQKPDMRISSLYVIPVPSSPTTPTKADQSRDELCLWISEHEYGTMSWSGLCRWHKWSTNLAKIQPLWAVGYFLWLRPLPLVH